MRDVMLALNRTCAPGLDLAAFLELACKVGASGVEIRTDIPGREGADGTPVAEIRTRIEAAGPDHPFRLVAARM